MRPDDTIAHAARVARSAERKRRKRLIYKLSRMLVALTGDDPDAPFRMMGQGSRQWVVDGTKKYVKRMPEAKRILARLNYEIDERQLDEHP